MRFERSALFACCCLSAACGGSGKSTGTQDPGFANTVSLTANGASLALSAQAGSARVNSPFGTQITGADAAGLTAPHTVLLDLGAYPPTAATRSCGTDGVEIDFATGGRTYKAGSAAQGPTATACTITVTSYSGFGQALEGTFSGTVAEQSTGATVVITNGQFKVAAP